MMPRAEVDLHGRPSILKLEITPISVNPLLKYHSDQWLDLFFFYTNNDIWKQILGLVYTVS